MRWYWIRLYGQSEWNPLFWAIYETLWWPSERSSQLYLFAPILRSFCSWQKVAKSSGDNFPSTLLDKMRLLPMECEGMTIWLFPLPKYTNNLDDRYWCICFLWFANQFIPQVVRPLSSLMKCASCSIQISPKPEKASLSVLSCLLLLWIGQFSRNAGWSWCCDGQAWQRQTRWGRHCWGWRWWRMYGAPYGRSGFW